MYGIIISFAIIISLILGEKIAKDNKIDTNVYWGASLWVILGGVVGARVYHVIDYADHYLSNPITVLFIHQGGLGIYGAVIGGAMGLYLFSKFQKRDFLALLNVSAIVIPLAQAVGRWANYFNTELYGIPTNLPWGLYVPPGVRPLQYENNDIFQPIFLYESFLDIVLFFVLLLLYQRKTMLQKKYFQGNTSFSMMGFFTLIYIVGYGLIRFPLEFLRINPWEIYGINVAQSFSLIFIIFGLGGLYKIIKK